MFNDFEDLISLICLPYRWSGLSLDRKWAGLRPEVCVDWSYFTFAISFEI